LHIAQGSEILKIQLNEEANLLRRHTSNSLVTTVTAAIPIPYDVKHLFHFTVDVVKLWLVTSFQQTLSRFSCYRCAVYISFLESPSGIFPRCHHLNVKHSRICTYRVGQKVLRVDIGCNFVNYRPV